MKLLNIKQNTLSPNQKKKKKKKKTLLTRLNYLSTFGYVRRNSQLAMNNIHAGKMNFSLGNFQCSLIPNQSRLDF